MKFIINLKKLINKSSIKIPGLISSLFFISLSSLIFLSCGKGITPTSVTEEIKSEGFGGIITFIGNWSGNVTRTHLVVFENPLTSPDDFTILNLKYVSEEIPFGVQQYSFSSLDTAAVVSIGAGEYAYVAVAQQVTETVSFNREDWFVVGIYYADNDTSTPGKLIIPEDTFVQNVNIICDFNNPPPQPPGGE